MQSNKHSSLVPDHSEPPNACPSLDASGLLAKMKAIRYRSRPIPRRQAFVRNNDNNNNNLRERGSPLFTKRQSKKGQRSFNLYGKYIEDPIYTIEDDDIIRRSYGKVTKRDWKGYEAMLQRQLFGSEQIPCTLKTPDFCFTNCKNQCCSFHVFVIAFDIVNKLRTTKGCQILNLQVVIECL